MHARPEQRLIGVDVADAGDVALVEQERFHRHATPAAALAQVLGAERIRERLDAEALSEVEPERIRAVHEMPGAEPTWVDVQQAVPGIEPEPDPGVDGLLRRVD